MLTQADSGTLPAASSASAPLYLTVYCLYTFAFLSLFHFIIFLPVLLSDMYPPSSLFTPFFECSLVWSVVKPALNLSVMPAPIFICFAESRPQQRALTGPSIMLGLVIDLRRASGD